RRGARNCGHLLPARAASWTVEHGGAAGRNEQPVWCRREGRGRGPDGAEPRQPGGNAGGRGEGTLRGKGKAVQSGPAALPVAADYSRRGGHAVEGPPAIARPLEGRHRAARLRAEGSARRVQEGSVHFV